MPKGTFASRLEIKHYFLGVIINIQRLCIDSAGASSPRCPPVTHVDETRVVHDEPGGARPGVDAQPADD